MNIQLDSDLMKSLVSEAILKSLDQNKRDTLIQGAIQTLLTPEPSTYGRSKSPIETAFEYAVKAVATKQAEEMLTSNPSVTAKITELITEAFTKVIETNRDKTIDNLASAITNGLTYRDRY